MSLIQKLRMAAKPYGLPITSLADMNLDAKTLKRSSGPFLWIIKESGTVLLPLKEGVNPAYAEFATSYKHQCFLVEDSNSIVPINTDKAMELIQEPPVNLDNAWTQDGLIRVVNNSLNLKGVRHCMTSECELTEMHSWGAWKGWFQETGHYMMANFMDKAISRSQELRKVWQ